MTDVTITLNGARRSFTAAPRESLLHLIREQAHLTGTKCGCDIGECGACTVLLDGRPVNSCCILAEQIDGCTVETIESLGTAGEPHPIQRAFADAGAIQCGFCTPGMILSAKALLDRNSDPDDEEIRAALSGNLCRCTGYAKIVAAVRLAACRMRQTEG